MVALTLYKKMRIKTGGRFTKALRIIQTVPRSDTARTNDDGSFHYKKHKIYLYKEDFTEFREILAEMTDYIIIMILLSFLANNMVVY